MNPGLRHRVLVVVGSLALVSAGFGLATSAHGSDPTSKVKAETAAVVPAVVAAPSPSETVYTPIAPCRTVDTRVAGGRVTSSGRSFLIGGTGNFAAQGGTGCGIPASATAVSADFIAVQETAPGYLKAYPYGTSVPTASTLDFTTGAIANEVPVAITPGTGPALTVMASNPAQVVIDITGYYAPQIAAWVGADGTLFSATARIVSVSSPSVGTYRINVDRDVSACSMTATTTSTGTYVAATPSEGTASQIAVFTWTLSSTAVKVLTPENFELMVAC